MECVAQGTGVLLWDEHLKQQIYLGDSAFIVRRQKPASLDSANSAAIKPGQKIRRRASPNPSISKIHITAPVHGGDLERYAARKTTRQDQRNPNIADAVYPGGHRQTAIAPACGISSLPVSHVVAGLARGNTS